MKDNSDIVEQAENSASKIGKFNTAGDLLAAYNALECEFTKRCQLIKQLQAELDKALSAQAAMQSQAETDAPAPLEQSATADVPIEQKQAVRAEQGEPASVQAATTADAVEPDTAVDLESLADAVVGEVARNTAAYVEALCGIPEIMDACVARYKRRLIEARVIGSPTGVAVIAPSARPRTLADAKALADKLISKA